MPILESGFTFTSPTMVKVHQELRGATLSRNEIRAALAREWERPEVAGRIRPGMRIALGVGSRGISNLALVVHTTIEILKARGANPFIVPAMGSHGGGTSEGQREVLAAYGITEASMGVPIDDRMDTVELGEVDGLPVHFSRAAMEADLIVPVCRVKPHTDFKATIESGYCKMLVIGFGKHRGASTVHRLGMQNFGTVIPKVATFIRDHAPVGPGVALVENGHDETALVEIITPERMLDDEARLLALAKSYLPTIGIDPIDVLIVDRIGKNISGAGMDPNVTGRSGTPAEFPDTPTIGRIVVLGLTEETHGNATGIGLADIITRRCYEQIDWPVTYTNVVTAGSFEAAKIPMVLDTDQAALAVALKAALPVDPEQARVVRIPDTLHLETLWVSRPVADELRSNPRFTVTGETRTLSFDAAGNLTW
ncbi:MAG: DUF362 domain-containing protein [Actinomycetia bacterium]|nr:DUF362 domain-containing protein [Actinomycetes bacterium]